MDNFSYMCVVCDQQVIQHSHVHLYLLDAGKVLEVQTGYYNGYGSTYVGDSEPVVWAAPTGTAGYANWAECMEMHFGPDNNTGFAAVHVQCGPHTPVVRSYNDPDQGLPGITECDWCYQGFESCVCNT